MRTFASMYPFHRLGRVPLTQSPTCNRYRAPARWLLGAAGMASLLALAACGGGSGGGGGPVASAPTTPTTPTAPTTPAEPTTPTTPTDPGTPTAPSCLRAALYTTVGTTATLHYQVEQGGTTRQVRQVSTVGAATTFNGQAASPVTVQETIQSSGVADQLFDGTHYLVLADARVYLLGTVSRFRSAGASRTQTITLTPRLPDLDFSLASGASTSTTASVAATLAPATGTGSAAFTATSTLRYAGTETVTVPAGTFVDACKFVQELGTATQRSTTRWIAAGSGVVLRTESGGTVQSLVSGTVDGVAVAP